MFQPILTNLIGATGYVGQSLLSQRPFTHQYSSTNIGDIREQKFSLVICCAAPAKKWIAYQDPNADRENIERLIQHLQTITCDAFVLISTVDVFKQPTAVSESSPVDEESLQPYGLNRRLLEKFVQDHFSKHLIVRLPGLVSILGGKIDNIFDVLNKVEN